MFLFRNPSVWFAFLETESMWGGGVQERLSEIVTPKYWRRGLILGQCHEVYILSGWDI